MLYGICGLKGAGKDTFADLILDAGKGFHKASFAGSLKAICQRVFSLSDEQVNCPIQKEAPLPTPVQMDIFVRGLESETSLKLPRLGLVAKTAREILQYVGTDYVRSVQDDYWISRAFSDTRYRSKALFSDVRFPNEANAIRERGGKIIRILRIDSPTPEDSHASEAHAKTMRADLTIGAVTGDLSLPKKVAWLVAISRFDNALHYDWPSVTAALDAYQSGMSLEHCAEIMGFTGKDPYAFKNTAEYYGVPLRKKIK